MGIAPYSVGQPSDNRLPLNCFNTRLMGSFRLRFALGEKSDG
jgi:hypothetical protein